MNPLFFFRRLRTALLVSCLLALCGTGGSWGCGGGETSETEDVGTGSGDAPQDLVDSFDTVATVVTTALNVQTSSALEIAALATSVHVHCSNGEQAAVSGDISGDDAEGTFDLAVDLGGCDGVDGDMGFSGTYETVGANRNFESQWTGTALGNGCSMSLGGLSYDFSVETDIIEAPVSESLAGTLTATCTEAGGTASINCNFGDGVDAKNTAALKAACSCDGDGCT